MKNPTPKSKKRSDLAGNRSPRNRYMRSSKLSEYKFLRVLRGFADELTIKELSEETRISERSIRSLFGRLRRAVLEAAMAEPKSFGWAGYFLFDGDAFSERGHHMIDVVSGSDVFRRFLNHHEFRLGLTTDEVDDNFAYILAEATIRIFCMLSMNKDNETLYSDEMQEAYAGLQLVALYIAQHQSQPDDPSLFRAALSSFERVVTDFPRALAQDEFRSLVQGFKLHRYPNDLFYDDLRRYLLKYPLSQ